jgi:bifunctional DNA-binding transcriptional regulator/antitoxin component of YhaV-PrlF toxin-antitoxin module/predicted RNase H-like HicB family nuclease
MEGRNTYKLIATREGGWWSIEVPEIPGVFSQARRLDQAEETARDGIALMLEVPEDSFDVVVEAQLPLRYRLTLGEHGRLELPAELRRSLGLEAGTDLVAFREGHRLVLERREDAVAEMAAMLAHLRREGVSAVDELIAERRAEAAREDGEDASH